MCRKCVQWYIPTFLCPNSATTTIAKYCKRMCTIWCKTIKDLCLRVGLSLILRYYLKDILCLIDIFGWDAIFKICIDLERLFTCWQRNVIIFHGPSRKYNLVGFLGNCTPAHVGSLSIFCFIDSFSLLNIFTFVWAFMWRRLQQCICSSWMYFQ